MARNFYTLTLPPEDYPNYSYNTILDNKEYKLNFKFSVRNSSWYISIYEPDGTLLLSNCRLVPWLSLLAPYTKEDLPAGDLVLAPISTVYPKSPDITLANLSTDFELLYYSVN